MTMLSWLDELEATYAVPPDPGYGPPTVDVALDAWSASLRLARDVLRCEFFDYLTAVDELDDSFSIVAHVARRQIGSVDSVLVRTRMSPESPGVACVCEVYAGAAWHEREMHEMFGFEVVGHDRLDPLLLPDGFDGHPLRKDFVLASRVAKPWPGAKEPGESEHESAPSRRRTRPPGVPDPEAWGPTTSR